MKEKRVPSRVTWLIFLYRPSIRKRTDLTIFQPSDRQDSDSDTKCEKI